MIENIRTKFDAPIELREGTNCKVERIAHFHDKSKDISMENTNAGDGRRSTRGRGRRANALRRRHFDNWKPMRWQWEGFQGGGEEVKINPSTRSSLGSPNEANLRRCLPTCMPPHCINCLTSPPTISLFSLPFHSTSSPLLPMSTSYHQR